MKTIEIDEDLYRYIASHTQDIGESASDILRRMLGYYPAIADVVSDAMLPTKNEVVAKDTQSLMVTEVDKLLLSTEWIEQKKVVNRFMLILTTLYQLDPALFEKAAESLHGRKRIYFAFDAQTLLKHGTHTKPKQIAGTPYWVITNTNSQRKKGMIEHVMGAMQFPAILIENVCHSIKSAGISE